MSQASSNEAALEALLQVICTETQWIVGEVWLPQGDHHLHHSGISYCARADLQAFEQESRTWVFAPGEGLPGRVWQRGAPEWLVDVSHASLEIFPRREMALRHGLGAAVGIPVSGEGAVVMVLVFFMERVHPWDEQHVALLEAIAHPLGTYLCWKRAETQLIQNQQHLNRLVDTLPGIVFTAQGPPDWEMRSLSKGCEQLTGYTHAELTQAQSSLSYNKITHPADLPQVLATIEQALMQRQTYEVEYRIITREGHEKWVWEKGHGILDDQGRVRGLEGFITDITSLKTIEAALQEREKFLTLVLDSIPQQLFWKDVASVYRGCNQAFATALGVPDPAAIIGKTDDEIAVYTEAMAAKFRQQDQTVITTGQPLLNLLEQQPGNPPKWLNCSKFPILDQEQKVVGVLGCLEDVSDRIQFQQALEQREQYLSALVELQQQLLTLDAPWDSHRYREVLAPLGTAAAADRVCLYEINPTPPHPLQQRAQWITPGSTCTWQHPVVRSFDLDGPIKVWLDQLRQGQCINQTEAEFPPALRSQLSDPSVQVRSVLLLPLMVHGTLAGLIGFSSCSRLRKWTPSEVAMLRVAANAIAIATERYQMKASLQAAEQKYRSIVENAVEGIFQSTLGGRYLTVNPMLARIYGYESPQDLMDSLTDIQHQLYVDPYRRDMFVQEILQKGSVVGFESAVYRKDGSVIWISESARSIYDDQGRPIGFEGTVKDITDLRQHQLELQRRDLLLEGVAKASQHLLTNANLDSAFPEVLRILGTAAQVDRVYIYENHPHPVTQTPAMSMRYEWTHEGIAPTIQQPHWQNKRYEEDGLWRWHEAFQAGQPIRGLISDFPPAEQQLLAKDAVQSILMVPIFIDQTLWGYIGFDACQEARLWTPSEESILVIISASIGGALKRRHTEAQMRHQAFHDALTGLPNRSAFNHYLALGIAQSQQDASCMAVMFLDLDRFKNVNDTLGHAIGDELLIQATQRLRQELRKEDMLARWGGDEFILISRGLESVAEAEAIAQRLEACLKPPFPINQQELYITSSIGIALYPLDGEDVSTLLQNADAALYAAKAAGRNTYRFYAASLNSKVSEQLRLEGYLHQALQQDEFHLVFQPQIDLERGTICKVEALVRWHSPQLGLVSPIQFIPVAEDIGLIIELGNWVLKEACQQLKHWHQQGFESLCVAVNLSARQLQQPLLVHNIQTTLAEYDLPPQSLEIEITETAALSNLEASILTLNQLRQLGTQIVMDDFGTGYSSLSYLKRLPFHGLKIDRAFVQGIPADTQDIAMLRAMIALGQELQLDVVAEGVETAEQVACLRDLGCTLMQGYWFSHPLEAAAMTQLLHQGRGKVLLRHSSDGDR